MRVVMGSAAPMASSRRALTVSIALVLLGTVSAGFYDDYKVLYGGQNIVPNDAQREVTLIMTGMDGGGASFASKDPFLFGSFSVRHKVVPGDAAGTVSAFFVHSDDGAQWDEIDFEFLGNVSGEPYLLHTNLFVNGVGGRESQFFLWFDPRTDYHNYTILWNQAQVVWIVDNIPIRVHKNSDPSIYPHLKPMYAHGTLYDASSWATRGGAVPLNWSHAPFVVNFEDFTFQTCKVINGNTSPCRQNIASNPWEQPEFQTLSTVQRQHLRQVRAWYMTYDYCLDRVRFPTVPPECAANAQASAL